MVVQMETYTPDEMDQLIGELIGWMVTRFEKDHYQAYSPDYQEDGVVIEASSPEQLIERVRTHVQIVAIAADIAGRLRPNVNVAGVWTGKSALEDSEPPKPAVNDVQMSRLQGYTGDTCMHCQGMRMVRNGTCLKCMDCGETTGCS